MLTKLTDKQNKSFRLYTIHLTSDCIGLGLDWIEDITLYIGFRMGTGKPAVFLKWVTRVQVQ
jgi:hypothetical protein